MTEYFLELKNVSKSFGKVSALTDINMRVGYNEIVGLIGDNGAGKSTLIKIISGLFLPDLGEIYLRGRKVEHWSTSFAHREGIETVYQDKALADQQTISSNIFMGREVCNFGGYINIWKQKKETEDLMKEMGFTSKLLSPDSVVLTCSGGEREGVAISRAMYFQANLVILDEPTTVLSLMETKKVLDFVLKIKERDKSCILITHNIYHAYEVSDRFVILDRGRIAEMVSKQEISCENLMERMAHIARSGV